MKVNAKFAGWRLPSLGHALAALLMIGWGLAATCPAQTPGQVAVSQGPDGEYILDLSAAAPPGGSDVFVFEFPDLWAKTVLGPDFAGSFCCLEGCDHDWVQSGDTLRGIEIRLHQTTFDSGSVAQIVGWPIIDNIDFKTRSDDNSHPVQVLHVAAIDDGLRIDCSPTHGTEACIEVLDLQGRMRGQVRQVSRQPPLSVTGLEPGVYLVRCYFGTALMRKKVHILH
jgi:hypothetical protein